MSPQDFGFSKIPSEELFGGDSIEASAKIFQSILKNEASDSQKNVVISNSAMVLSMVKNISLGDAILLAKETLESKKAFQLLQKLVNL
jgi:anthranilate phosphoribosyltransferase